MRKRILIIAATALAVSAPAIAQSVFFGSLHAHTSYSDGSGTPEDAYKAARAAGLDFFAITEHNHRSAESGAGARADGRLIATDPGLYRGRADSLVETADRLNDDGDFVTLYGQEYSTISSGNHMNVFGVPDVITVANGAFNALVAWANGLPASAGGAPLMQMNHPNNPASARKDYGRDDFTSDSRWVAALDPLVELIEVLSGPALNPGIGLRPSPDEAPYLAYLDLGFHAAPSSGQDNHFRNWGTSTDTRTAVIASRLTRADILAALRGRHAYATQDKNLRIIYRANGALQGDVVRAPASGSSLSLSVSVRDDDEPTANYRVEVLTDMPRDGRPAARAGSPITIRGNTPSPVTLPALPFQGRGQYVLLRITQTDAGGGADRAWTAPVWFE
ncbi:MAG TPA: CehA/McbA family metallohydrolase [Allosphingosinicella sp.]|jgi:hypothetical protein|nr:CehA/McbA family metallohydrolase [Allosphingosinicella sp.]